MLCFVSDCDNKDEPKDSAIFTFESLHNTQGNFDFFFIIKRQHKD